MAKGNDGNLLQHSVECALAHTLCDSKSGLHLVCTHAMAPYEAFEQQRWGAHRLIDQALKIARNPQARDEPPVVGAYRDTNANGNRSPNSADLIPAIMGA